MELGDTGVVGVTETVILRERMKLSKMATAGEQETVTIGLRETATVEKDDTATVGV